MSDVWLQDFFSEKTNQEMHTLDEEMRKKVYGFDVRSPICHLTLIAIWLVRKVEKLEERRHDPQP